MTDQFFTYNRLTMREFSGLLKAARSLDQKALTEIFDLFSPDLYKFISRFVQDPNAADQMVADEFAQLIEDFAAGQGPRGHLRCHLCRSAYRRMVDKRQATNPSTSLKLVIPTLQNQKNSLSPANAYELSRLEVILSAMNTELTDDQRMVIVLRFLENFSVKETADILSKEVSNIKVIQSRGFARLRKSLGMEPNEDPKEILRL